MRYPSQSVYFANFTPLMQQQPLAFTLVKTVVSARDEGKELSPALATAWDLLRTELSPAHRVIASEVSWAPNHQEDLRFVIEGIRKQFEKDPELEGEFLAFLAEVEPFGKSDDDEAILPILTGLTTGSNISAPVGEVDFALDDVSEPNIDVSLEELIRVDEPIGDSSLDKIQDEHSSTSEVNEIEPVVENKVSPLEEIDIQDKLDYQAESPNLKLEEIEPNTIPLETNAKPNEEHSISSTDSLSPPLLKYWPFAAVFFLFAVILFGTWMFSSSGSEIEVIPEPATFESDSDTTLNISTSNSTLELESTVEYTTPSIAMLSKEVDSLRLVGDYANALSQQQEIAKLLIAGGSPAEESAQALSELAILYATQDNILQAIVEQRKSLGFARQAFTKTDPALGRTHLKLASFYTKNNELHMARAHLQQARKIFGQAQELVSPTDLDRTVEVEQQILNAS